MLILAKTAEIMLRHFYFKLSKNKTPDLLFLNIYKL